MTFAELYAQCTPDQQVMLDERAAIYEYDAGMTRKAAEQQAADDFRGVMAQQGLFTQEAA
jgi:hypothetical protein